MHRGAYGAARIGPGAVWNTRNAILYRSSRPRDRLCRRAGGPRPQAYGHRQPDECQRHWAMDPCYAKKAASSCAGHRRVYRKVAAGRAIGGRSTALTSPLGPEATACYLTAASPNRAGRRRRHSASSGPRDGAATTKRPSAATFQMTDIPGRRQELSRLLKKEFRTRFDSISNPL